MENLRIKDRFILVIIRCVPGSCVDGFSPKVEGTIRGLEAFLLSHELCQCSIIFPNHLYRYILYFKQQYNPSYNPSNMIYHCMIVPSFFLVIFKSFSRELNLPWISPIDSGFCRWVGPVDSSDELENIWFCRMIDGLGLEGFEWKKYEFDVQRHFQLLALQIKP